MPQQLIHEVTYICILNACSHSGLVDEALSIIQKIPVKTAAVWTTMCEKMSEELVAHGHEYDSNRIMRPMTEDGSVESILCGYSERLCHGI
ncbi:unnamed protein product [Adineta ricciae]|uniref:Uncharacterized protein n=1 Tax=Adineta ricciae TaxID=249248 RepID=A0A815V005_ADIRI|nr:unnamed protein product [Adineta ricciae]